MNQSSLNLQIHSPVVIIADLIDAGLQVGWRVLRRPTMPETWGHDIEVPDIELNRTLRVSKSWFVGPCAFVKAAITLTPGAVISGWVQRNCCWIFDITLTSIWSKKIVLLEKYLKNLRCDGIGSLRRKSSHDGGWLRANACYWMSDIGNGIPVKNMNFDQFDASISLHTS